MPLTQHGSGAVEFVCLLPFAFFVIFTFMQFVFYIIAGSLTQYAAFAASRAVLVYNHPLLVVGSLLKDSDAVEVGLKGDGSEIVVGWEKGSLFNLNILTPLKLLIARAPVVRMPCVGHDFEDNPLRQGELCR